MPRLKDSRTEETLQRLAQLASRGSEKMLALLESGALDENPMALNVLTGTALDKIAKYERWESAGHGEAGEWTRQLVAGLQQLGKVTLTVEALPDGQPEQRVIEAEVLPKRAERA